MNPIEMSLGEIIKLNRRLKKGQGAPGRARLAGGQGVATGSFRNPGSGSGVKSRRETGRIQKSKYAWAKTRGFQKSKSKFNGENGLARVMVSNLDYGVSDTDIKELFKASGMLRKANVHFDSFGFSLGTADVIFKYRDDAIRAIRKFQGMPLDGRPMKLHLLMDANDVEHNSFEPHPFKPRPFKSRPFKSGAIKPRSQDDSSSRYSSSRLDRDPYRVRMGQQKYKYI